MFSTLNLITCFRFDLQIFGQRLDYPLHYEREQGWGFLVPFRSDAEGVDRLPMAELLARCPVPEFARQCASKAESDLALDMLPGQVEQHLGKREHYKKLSQKQQRLETQYRGGFC